MRKRIISMLLTAAMVLTLMPAAFAAEGESGTKTVVQMGYSTILENDGIYVPAEGNIESGPPADVRVADKVDEEPQNGNYIKYNNGIITVHGAVTFTSNSSSPIYVKSGTLTITGDEDASLTLKCTSGGSPVQIGSANTSANLVLAGGVNFTATHESTVPVIGSYSRNTFETAENYNGDISLESNSMAINGGNVNLKTSGSISLLTSSPTTSTSPLVTAENISLEGSSVVIDSPNASPMISVSNDVSIKTTEGNLAIASDSTAAPTISSTGTVTLSAPKGDITISNSATGSGYFAQAISAQNVVVKDTENFIVDGGYSYAISANEGSFTATNCHAINIENKAENGNGAVKGNVNITGDGSENGQAAFKSKGVKPCISGDVKIKNFDIVNIFAEKTMAVNSTDSVAVENCGLVQIGNINSNTPAVSANNNIQFENCDTVEVSSENGIALNSTYGNISFEKCNHVTVESESASSSAIITSKGTTAFTGCKSVSVKNGGTDENSPSAISGAYTCDGKITITEKGTTKIIENGKEPVITGGDVTNTGLDLSDDEDIPTEETVYVAGGGTITFIPAKDGNNAKLVLDNAEIEINDYGSAINFSDDVDIELKGTNKFIAYNGIGSDGTINISGSGTLNVEAQYYGVIADEGKDVVVNSGTLVLSGQEGIHAGKNITVNGGDITVTPSYNGYGLYTYEGDITIKDGTLNISSDAEDACGICADGEMDGETGKISGGNVLIHGGTVNIAVEQEAIFAYDNVKIDSDAKVMATSTDEYDGIYAYKGNIDINGNAKVTATGGCDGIHVNEGNVNIGDSAEVIATDGEDGIFASEGNITIKDNAKVTAKSNGNAAIYTNRALTIGGNAVVTADGAEGKADIYTAEGCTVSDSANLNALVKINLGQTESKQEKYSYIAYGICDNNNITMDIDENNTLEVKSGAEFAINAGTAVTIADLSALTLDGKIINNGRIELRNIENPEETVKNMNLTGTGFVTVSNNGQESYYANDGTVLKQIGDIDLRYEDQIPDGCTWDADTKTLTLKDIIVGLHITGGLTENVTIKTEGHVMIGNMDNITSQSLTLTGDVVKVNEISSNGNLVIENKIADIGAVSNANGNSKLIFRNTTAEVKTINWPDISPDANKLTYGVELVNSKVTVGGSANSQFFAGKIAMDDNSVLTLNNVPIKNYGNYPDGLDGLKPYLPTGYKIAQFVESETAADKPYTIVDANNSIVRDITLKKAETTKPSGGSGGGGGSSTQYYNITVKSAENGTVEADKKTAAKDAVVTLTVKAAEGYQLDKLTVADSKNAAIALTDKGNGKYEFKMPAGAVTVTAAFAKTQTEPTTTFTDVPENTWYQTAVAYVSGKGLMNGIGENKFGPTQLTDRGMLVTTLWRMEGSPSSKQAAGFTDVKETDYFYTAVQWAAENKIVNGTSATTFAPNASITREQLATILYRYAAYKGYDVEQGGMAIREFDDYEKISEFAKTGTAWAVNTGIISGKGNQTLDPQGVATRAEIAAMLMRFCENIAK